MDFFMDRKSFFKKLHADLASKYAVPKKYIGVVRRIYFSRRFTQKQTGIYLLDRMKLSRKRRHLNTLTRQKIVAFIAKLTLEQWKDITKITEFDTQ